MIFGVINYDWFFNRIIMFFLELFFQPWVAAFIVSKVVYFVQFKKLRQILFQILHIYNNKPIHN